MFFQNGGDDCARMGGAGQAHIDLRPALPLKILHGEAPLCIPDFVQTAHLVYLSRLLLIVFESRPSFFLKGSRPSPLPPIPFFKSPPRQKSEWRGAARREGGTR